MTEQLYVLAAVVWATLWFTWLLPAVRARRARQQFEEDALTRRQTAAHLYPLMGPDYLHGVLRNFERVLDLNDRAAELSDRCPSSGTVPATPTVRVPPAVWGAPITVPPAEPVMASAPAPSATGTEPPLPQPAPLVSIGHVVLQEPVPPTPAPVDVVEEGPHFEPGEPTTLWEYGSQSQVISYLQASIAALAPEEAATKPMVMLGPAGLGKTSLMRAFGNTLRLRNAAHGYARTPYIEVFPADVGTRDDLERILRGAQAHPTVLQIDEIHTLDQEHAVLLYTLLTEGRYQFARARGTTAFPHLTVVAATTDWAACHPALRRRFQQLQLQPVTKADITRALRARPFPMTDEALESLVSRTHWSGVLFEALRYYEQGVVYAKAADDAEVTLAHMEAVYNFNDLDEYGLTGPDRRIIQVLLGMPRTRRAGRNLPDELVCYGGPEAQVAQVSGLDIGSYRLIHKPRLMHRQLLTTRQGYGQVLTERAVQMYGAPHR